MPKRKQEDDELPTNQNGTILVNKPIGWTPLQVIKSLKSQFPELSATKMSYAGRLDPMARGLLVILHGDNVKKQKVTELTQKVYQFEVLFGLQTDTYDLLGICDYYKNTIAKPLYSIDHEKLKCKLADIIQRFVGKYQQPYPPYSSARVEGKPLFYWAKEGKLEEVEVPVVAVEVFALTLHDLYTMNGKELCDCVLEKVNKVTSGDFRQEEIKKQWRQVQEMNETTTFALAKFEATVSSGTYVRSIANQMGQMIKVKDVVNDVDSDAPIGALAYDIYRTRAGEYSIEDAIDTDSP